MLRTIVYYVGILALVILWLPLGFFKELAVCLTVSVLLAIQYDRGLDEGIKIGSSWTVKIVKAQIKRIKKKT